MSNEVEPPRRVSFAFGTRRLRFIFVLLLAALILGPHSAEARAIIQKGDVVIAPLRGEIGPSLFLFIRRAVKAAENDGASAIILEMDTYGGRLDSAEEISGVLNRAIIPTYTFINSNAGSAGALIAMATKHIWMSPVSAIGAAAPVLSSGEDLPPTARDKTVSYWSAIVRASALRNGHNPDVGEAFISKEKEVKIGDRVVHPKGSLLTLSAPEAVESIGGKPLLADGIADSIDELVKKANLNRRTFVFAPSGFEQLAFWITALAPLLLLGGLIGAYLEMKMPGATLPGVVAAICFALFFLGHHLAGLAGWETVALFVVGVALVVIEVLFFAHSTILVGVAGVSLILASLVWTMIDRYPGETFWPNGHMLAVPLTNLFIALIAAAGVIALIARYLPRTSIYRRFVLAAANPPGPSLAGQVREFAATLRVAVGATGVAVTTLRPSGKARFAEQIIDVVTAGEFVAEQSAVRVISADGMRVVVRAA